MDFSKLASASGPLPRSQLSVNELIKITQTNFFKVSIKERASTLGKFKYLGWKPVLHRNKKKQLVVYFSLYFYHQGSNYAMSKNSKGKTIRKRQKRQTYLLIAKFPHSVKIKNMKRLYNENIQLFSSDPSFKFTFCYALNNLDAVITDEPLMIKWLGSALTDPPNNRNDNWDTHLTKHFWRLFQFISNVRPKVYLDEKYLIPNDVKIVNPKIGS
ncbi:MAG: hypothetical protein KAI79_06865 [Bacteroidales bacterium]|nr:hypothetical protein [Bacteroidales bacterium]